MKGHYRTLGGFMVPRPTRVLSTPIAGATQSQQLLNVKLSPREEHKRGWARMVARLRARDARDTCS